MFYTSRCRQINLTQRRQQFGAHDIPTVVGGGIKKEPVVVRGFDQYLKIASQQRGGQAVFMRQLADCYCIQLPQEYLSLCSDLLNPIEASVWQRPFYKARAVP